MVNTRIADGFDLTAFGHTGLKQMADGDIRAEEVKLINKMVQMLLTP